MYFSAAFCFSWNRYGRICQISFVGLTMHCPCASVNNSGCNIHKTQGLASSNKHDNNVPKGQLLDVLDSDVIR